MKNFIFDTKHKVLIYFLLLFQTVNSQYFDKKFIGCWAETIWEFNFSKDGNFKRSSSGHFGATVINGKYEYKNNKIQILYNLEETNGTINEFYIIKDNVLIDLKLGYGYRLVIDSDLSVSDKIECDLKYPISHFEILEENLKLDEVFNMVTDEYEIYKVANEKAILILFPCYPCDIQNTKNEFPIIEQANKHGVSVVLMDYHNKLFLKDDELKDLTTLYNSIFQKGELKSKNIYIGGFSGGGNISLLLSNHLVKEKNKFRPNGVFIVDSPIDLLGLYRVAEKNIRSNFSEDSVGEAKWIISKFTSEFGNPKESISKYNYYSPFTYETVNTSNLEYLSKLKLRFYSEPDLLWWKTNRNNDKEDLNAFFIEELYKKLQLQKFLKVEFITSENKGYRADGTRHPHSWSIVEKEELLKWILE